ncbi:MAG TPA: HD domain-containing protein [Asanoa sp.]|nr:HD domain-containing protein [Asanoa sp.]
MPTVEETDAFAARCHEGQVDKAGLPYIEHPRTVAAALVEHGDEAVMAGLLHDVVEDCGVTLNQLRAMGYSERVVSAVDSVSHRDGETYLDAIRRAAADPLGRLVKLSDNATNGSEERLALLEAATADRLRRKYAKARAVLLSDS